MFNVSRLRECDICQGFIECLSELRPVGLTDDEAKSIFRKHNQNVYIVKTDDVNVSPFRRIVGCATLFLEQKFIHQGGVVAHIEDFVVSSYFRGMGVGKLLMERLIRESKEAGAYKIILDSGLDSLYFYQKCGFTPWEQQLRMDLDV